MIIGIPSHPVHCEGLTLRPLNTQNSTLFKIRTAQIVEKIQKIALKWLVIIASCAILALVAPFSQIPFLPTYVIQRITFVISSFTSFVLAYEAYRISTNCLNILQDEEIPDTPLFLQKLGQNTILFPQWVECWDSPEAFPWRLFLLWVRANLVFSEVNREFEKIDLIELTKAYTF